MKHPRCQQRIQPQPKQYSRTPIYEFNAKYAADILGRLNVKIASFEVCFKCALYLGSVPHRRVRRSAKGTDLYARFLSDMVGYNNFLKKRTMLFASMIYLPLWLSRSRAQCQEVNSVTTERQQMLELSGRASRCHTIEICTGVVLRSGIGIARTLLSQLGSGSAPSTVQTRKCSGI
jgi:hypothetical protein